MKYAWKALVVIVLGFFTMTPSGFAAFDPVGEDIDIFLANPALNTIRPNVLIVLDNTANWSQTSPSGGSKFDIEKPSLKTVVNGLTDGFNVGVMMFGETGNPNDNVDGGYVRFGVRQMTSTNKDKLKDLIDSFGENADKGNAAYYSLTMYEAYAYFAGVTARAGSGKAKRDYSGNTTYNPKAASLPGNAFTSAGSTTYVSPATSGCQKNFIIFISNGPANDNAAALSTAQTLLSGLVGRNPPDTIAISPSGSQNNWTDEYAKFMAQSGFACANLPSGTNAFVSTYIVEIDPGTTGQGPAHTALMKSAAVNGKGKYFAVSSGTGGAQIVTTLQSIFTEIQSVNSVFASTTLPVSVNVRGTNLNQVYIGVFRPDAKKSPRWPGNLKLYNLALFGTNIIKLADANGVQAENAATGFISGSATSFWTTASTFWSFRSPFDSTDIGQSSDSPDGDLVEKGGAAQHLRVNYATSQTARNLYTCTGACAANSSLASTPFSTSNTDITAGALGTYLKKSVLALISAGTTATATVTAHGFSTGNIVTIAGASPSTYNGDFSITNVDANTFTYTLGASLTGGIAYATAAGHGLNSGDKLDVTGCSGADVAYQATSSSIAKIDVNTFTYTPTGTPGASTTGCAVTGKKSVSSMKIYGQGGNAKVIATLPSHGYAAGDTITVSGATCPLDLADLASTNLCTQANGTYVISVIDADNFSYTVSGLSVTASSSTAVATFTGAHGYATGEPNLNIVGASPSTYNVTGANITVTDASTFTYPLGSSVTGDATGTISAQKTGATFTGASATHPTTGSSQDTATVTTASSHGFTAGQQVSISGASADAYNGTFTIASVPAPNQLSYTRGAVGGATTPATGTITAVQGATSKTVSTLTHPTTGSASSKNVATVTTVATHGFATGDRVTISGAGQVEYNGTWTITVTSTTAFTFTHSGISGAASSVSGLTAVGPASKTIATLGRYVVAVADASGTIFAGKRIRNPAGTTTNPTLTSANTASGAITAGRKTDADASGRDNLINWVRGQDNADDENSNGSLTDVRAYAHGDVLHSRPAVVNYNRDGTDNDVFIYYGANDGVFHAVQGGFGTTGGNEAWGFVPTEAFGKLQRLRDNTPTITSTTRREYFFDGPIGIYTKDLNGDGKLRYQDGDKVFLYPTMRRGGRFIYALDVSNPADPKFLWKKGCPNIGDNTGCDTGYSELGQTWSEPKIGYLRAYTNPVLIFGAGYDPAVEDIHPCLITAMDASGVTWNSGGSVTFDSSGSCSFSGTTSVTTPRSKGRGIFIVDATDGSVLQRIGPDASANRQVSGMAYSIVADTVAFNRDRDNTRALGSTKENVSTGFLDRIYAADTGGNIWRVDVDSATPSSWVVTQLASISGSANADKRKFLFAPGVVFGSDANGDFDAVLAGTGDREHPFDAVVNNRFYMFKDRKTGLDATGQATITESDLLDVTSNCIQDCTNEALRTGAASALLAAKGWMLKFGPGEKDVGSSATVSGTTFFNTNQPATQSTQSCGSNLGTAREYAVNFQDATANNVLNTIGTPTASYRSVVHAGGGFLPSPVPVVVQIGTGKYQAVISGTSVVNPGGATLERRMRTYWYRKID